MESKDAVITITEPEEAPTAAQEALQEQFATDVSGETVDDRPSSEAPGEAAFTDKTPNHAKVKKAAKK